MAQQKNDPLFETLIRNVREHVSISDEALQLFIDGFAIKRLSRKEILLFQGDVSNHMRFVTEGCLRSYYIDDQAAEHIIQFGIQGWWVNDLYSYLTEKPATCFIQAIQPSTVLQIHRNDLNRIYDLAPPVERFFRIKFQNAYVALQQRTIDRMSLPARERYENFIKQYRDIEQSVPQYMIASYLNVTPEFLSALRSTK